jgi:hypothetical protein
LTQPHHITHNDNYQFLLIRLASGGTRTRHRCALSVRPPRRLHLLLKLLQRLKLRKVIPCDVIRVQVVDTNVAVLRTRCKAVRVWEEQEREGEREREREREREERPSVEKDTNRE